MQAKLAETIDAPIGSRLLATGWFDNSANNPANPDPKREVRWGPQTDDELMLGYLEYYVPSLKPVPELAAHDLIFNASTKTTTARSPATKRPRPKPSARPTRTATAS